MCVARAKLQGADIGQGFFLEIRLNIKCTTPKIAIITAIPPNRLSSLINSQEALVRHSPFGKQPGLTLPP